MQIVDIFKSESALFKYNYKENNFAQTVKVTAQSLSDSLQTCFYLCKTDIEYMTR